MPTEPAPKPQAKVSALWSRNPVTGDTLGIGRAEKVENKLQRTRNPLAILQSSPSSPHDLPILPDATGALSCTSEPRQSRANDARAAANGPASTVQQQQTKDSRC